MFPQSVKDSLKHGSVVIAAITSLHEHFESFGADWPPDCLRKKLSRRVLTVPAWVKTSLAPGSKVVSDYLDKAGLMPYLEKLKFHIVGYGCTTCIGNSGPLPTEVSQAIDEKESGRRFGALAAIATSKAASTPKCAPTI